MQYSVPQFIDVENKIIGPISVRQFVMIVVAIAFVFISYRIFNFALFIVLTIFILLFTVIFAFVRVNGRPFHFFVLSLMQSAKSSHRRVWKKEPLHIVDKTKKKTKKKKEIQINYIQVTRQKEEARSRLSDLSLLVDTGGFLKRSNHE